MKQLMKRLQGALAEYRPEYLASLLPGASAEELAAFEEQFSCKLPDAFKEFYQWRNGQSPQTDEPLIDSWSFSSLAEIAATKAALDEMSASDLEEPGWWRSDWIPFLHNSGGSHLCVDLRAEEEGEPGQVREFWKTDDERPIVADDFEEWLLELIDVTEDAG